MLRRIGQKAAARMAVFALRRSPNVSNFLMHRVVAPLWQMTRPPPAKAMPAPKEPPRESPALAPVTLPAAPELPSAPPSDGPRPRALIIDATTPTPDRDSGSNDIYWFMRILLSLRYEVTFLAAFESARNPRYADSLISLGINCPNVLGGQAARDFVTANGEGLSLVVLYRIAVVNELFKTVRQFAPRAKVVFNTVDLTFLREQREAELNGTLKDFLYAKHLETVELEMIGAADAAIVVSEYEQELVGRLVPGARCAFIPVVRPVPGRLAPWEGRSGVLFVGGFAHKPNADAAVFLCGSIWPRVRRLLPDARLLIAGPDAPDAVRAYHGAEGIEVLGHVPDLDALYRGIRLSVAPLRFGAGLKGKVVGSLAVGLPCVATSVASEGMPPGWEKTILVADAPAAFARAAARIYLDQTLWYRMSDAGVAYARENFSVEATAARVRRLLEDLGLPPAAASKIGVG